MTVPTKEQIIARIEAVKDTDFFGAETQELLLKLDFEDAQPFLRPDVTREQWLKHDETPQEAAHKYLPFAWGKANNQRGLSANRSIDHMAAYLFLAGYEHMIEPMRDLYQFYGKPCLVFASLVFDFPWQDYDDGVWTNEEGGEGLTATSLAVELARIKTIVENCRAEG